MLVLQMQNLSFKDFYKQCPYNEETRNQMWMSSIADTHDSWCNCDTPFAHLLASIFPPGHRDRLLSIQQILERDYKQRCLSGGADAENSGMAAAASKPVEETDFIKREEDLMPVEELDALLAAAEKEENTR